jgi:hypothetical protein
MIQRFKYLVTQGSHVNDIYFYNVVGLARILNGRTHLDSAISMLPSLSFLGAGVGEVYDRDVRIDDVIIKGKEPEILERLPEAYLRVRLEDNGIVRLGFQGD